jgi:hypothetical protein
LYIIIRIAHAFRLRLRLRLRLGVFEPMDNFSHNLWIIYYDLKSSEKTIKFKEVDN